MESWNGSSLDCQRQLGLDAITAVVGAVIDMASFPLRRWAVSTRRLRSAKESRRRRPRSQTGTISEQCAGCIPPQAVQIAGGPGCLARRSTSCPHVDVVAARGSTAAIGARDPCSGDRRRGAVGATPTFCCVAFGFARAAPGWTKGRRCFSSARSGSILWFDERAGTELQLGKVPVRDAAPGAGSRTPAVG